MGPQGAEFELAELAEDVCTGWRVPAEERLHTGPVGLGSHTSGWHWTAGEPIYATGSTAVHSSAGTDLSKGEKSTS